ncbi:MAG: sigma-70 family RNA polymerase sigma factor [Lachnospiraceae bacterium]|nr:sigma-70 family RNA polymerase sigma factor [Lachnospiraceae bacterium]
MKPMEEIYQEYAKTVYRFLLSRTGNADLAEELTQETFYQAIRTVNRYDETCKVSTWLLGIAKNVLLTYRRKHPATEDIADQEIQVESAEDAALRSAERVELLRKLHELKEPQREVVYLRVFGGLSFREIGDIFAKTENWARVTFYRAKEQLRKELSDEQDSM